MKKAAALFCIICLMASCLSAKASGADSFSGGNGTADSPYQIRTAADLALLANNVNNGLSYTNSCFTLDGNIDLSGYDKWSSIGDVTHKFCGIFDGNGYKISNLSLSSDQFYLGAGLFTTIGESGVVRNLQMENCHFSAVGTSLSSRNIAAVAGYNQGIVNNCGSSGTTENCAGVVASNSGLVISCYNSGKVIHDSTGGGGGIVNSNYKDGQVISCSNTGTVINGGGIVGTNEGSISQCENTGEVKTNIQDLYVGGIVQENRFTGTVSECSNDGPVTAPGTFIENYTGAGGIVGNNRGNIAECINHGKITVTNEYGTAGGIVANNGEGYILDGSYSGAIIQACRNYGTVYSSAEETSIGGIAGYNNLDVGFVINCCNSGKITGEMQSKQSIYQGQEVDAGGIVGMNTGTMKNNCNTGEICIMNNGTSFVGGIIGKCEAGTVQNNYSLGPITIDGDNTYTGGVIGYLHCKLFDALIKNCYWKAGTTNTAIGFQQDNSTVESCAPFSNPDTTAFTVDGQTCIGLLSALKAMGGQWMQDSEGTYKASCIATQKNKDETELPFTDVPEDARYRDAVGFVYSKGLMKGTSNAGFSPNGTISRGQLALILYRMAGSPETKSSKSFTDVADGQWYTRAVHWVVEKKVASGFGNGTFGVQTPVTHTQLAAMLYRFTDVDKCILSGWDQSRLQQNEDGISAWARKYIIWSTGYGLMFNEQNSVAALNQPATRADTAYFLMYLQNRMIACPFKDTPLVS